MAPMRDDDNKASPTHILLPDKDPIQVITPKITGYPRSSEPKLQQRPLSMYKRCNCLESTAPKSARQSNTAAVCRSDGKVEVGYQKGKAMFPDDGVYEGQS